MKMHHVGWGLLVAGAVLSIAEAFTLADAKTNGTDVSTTTIGKIEAPFTFLPVQLGTALLLAGATVLWVVPFVKHHA